MTNKKAINILTIAVFLIFVFGFAIAFLIKPAEASSGVERRELQQLPELTWKRLEEGVFASEMNDYLNDQFPLRNLFLSVNGFFENLLLKKENNGILIGENNQLATRLFKAVDSKIHINDDGSEYVYPKTDYFYTETIEKCMSRLSEAFKAFNEIGMETAVILPPRSIDVASSAFDYPTEKSDALISAVRENAVGISGFVDMYDTFRNLFDDSEYIYYKGDHHWTTLGAYYAYTEIMKAFGEEYYSKDDFEITAVCNDFCGTTASNAGMFDVLDTIEIWENKNLPGSLFTTTVTNDKTGEKTNSFASFYDKSYLEGYDKYGMFLSGTNMLTFITKNTGEERETLLIFKDSFGHSLAPFLALHYDLVIVNLKDTGSCADLLKDIKIDKVLVCWNLENLITSRDLNCITYAVEAITQ